jgi:UDP-N-acetylmuramate: L-alanyl-gamma-D-glutamyl-meso-diaminopimelate ligase
MIIEATNRFVFTEVARMLKEECGGRPEFADTVFILGHVDSRCTLSGMRKKYPNKKLVACMELHTFSSLMADFLPQYKDCMAEADVAYVYFNPTVIEHKQLTPITKEDVRKAFGTKNVEVFTESGALQERLKSLDYTNTALLMMSSGTFDGINVKEFCVKLLNR